MIPPVDPIFAYLLLVLVNGQGMSGEGFGAINDCEARHAELLKEADVLAVSECTRLELKPVTKQ